MIAQSPRRPGIEPEGLIWPQLTSDGQPLTRRILSAIEQTEWLDQSTLQAMQLSQARHLLMHAISTVPYYRSQLGNMAFDPSSLSTLDDFRRLPILRRQDVQQNYSQLLSDKPPASHGRIYRGKTSGSTGRPIHFAGTELMNAFWKAFTIREHLWHNRNFSGSFSVIRANAPNNRQFQNWGSATSGLYNTGPSYTLDIRTDIPDQVNWLRDKQPTYLLTYPTNLQGILKHCAAENIRFPNLKGICTSSETLDPALSDLCKNILGVPLVDWYSAEEVGYIAFQCPASGLYHVQSENLLVEILNEEDKPCLAGEAGRIVLTSLVNFAMPLIRYEIGDYAIAGPSCPCGRGLPTFSRILGRSRNLLILPDGRRYWPMFGFHRWMELVPIDQMQVIQKTVTHLEVRFASPRALTAEEEQVLKKIINETLKYQFSISLIRSPDVLRGSGGKHEDFISEVNHDY